VQAPVRTQEKARPLAEHSCQLSEGSLVLQDVQNCKMVFSKNLYLQTKKINICFAAY